MSDAESGKGPASESLQFFDVLARRYFSIWIWSIVVGVTTTTTFSLMNFSFRSSGSTINMLIVPLYLLSGLVALMAWASIVQFFDRGILHWFTSGEEIPAKTGLILSRALKFSFLALALRVITGAVEIALNVLGSY